MKKDTLEKDLGGFKATESRDKFKPSAHDYSPGSDHVPVRLAGGKRPPRSAALTADERDKAFELERQNMDLKKKENYLESNLVLMRTKLRRIEELLRRKKQETERTADPNVISNDLTELFDAEVKKLERENEELREKNKKLKVIECDFIAKAATHSTKKPQNKYGHVRGKLGNLRQKQSDQDFDNLIEELRQQTVKGERQVINLTAQRNQLEKLNPGDSAGALKLSLDHQSRELNEINIKIAKMSGDLERDRVTFDDQKDLIEQKQREVHALTRDIQELSMKQQYNDVQAQTAQDLAEKLDEACAERNGLEAQIETLSTQPFFRDREGSAASIAGQIERLKIQLAEETRLTEALELEERQIDSEVTEAKATIERLKGERDVLQKQHNEAAQKFSAANADVTSGKLSKDLHDMDPLAYEQTMKDMEMRPDSYPLWRKVEFLEKQDGDPSSLEWLKKEKQKLLQGNKDLAAHLDKVQTLLRLQTDIEKENRMYFEAEKARVKLLADSSRLKEEEMQRRISNQAEVLRDIKQQLGLVQPATVGPDRSPGKPDMGASQIPMTDDIDTAIEIDETPIQSDENILDVKIQRGELNDSLICQLLANVGFNQGWNTLDAALTVVAFDFQNHDTRLSPPTQGQRPEYDTQLSFLNRVDSVYVTQLMQQRNGIEVWLYERGRKALMLGTADLILSDLVFQGAYGTQIRGPRQKFKLDVKPNPDLVARLEKAKQPASIGQLHIVAGLRKPIADMARYYTDMAAAKDTAHTKKATDAPRVLNVKIAVEKAEGLRVHYSNVAEIAPFFYYQFYTFDDFISSEQTGKDPAYRDVTTYKISLNNETVQYLKSQQLVVFLVDANGPQTGITRGGHGGQSGDEDLIGKVAVPLRQIAEAKSLPLTAYTLRDHAGRENGKVFVSITVTEVKPAATTVVTSSTGAKVVKTKTDQEQRLDRIVDAIAAKLGRKSIEIDTLFGLFSRGQDVCDFEDFKYTCLTRLNLKREQVLDEDDMNFLIDKHPRLKGKKLFNQQDFMLIFKDPIMQARKNIADEEAKDHAQMLRYQAAMREQQQAAGNFDVSMSATSTNMQFADFQRLEVQKILGLFILRSSHEEIYGEVQKNARGGSRIDPKDLERILKTFCRATEDENQRVVSLVTTNGVIFVDTFAKELYEALLRKRDEHVGTRKFNRMIETVPQQLARSFIMRDINKDGALNLDGFKSAMIEAGAVSEYQIPLHELEEVFKLVSTKNDFRYAAYMCEIDGRNKQYFSSIDVRPDDSVAFGESITDVNQSIELKTADRSVDTGNKGIPVALLQSAIEKVNAFLLSQDLTLSMLFNVIDVNSDSQLSKAEFKHQLNAMHLDLKPEELDALFKKLDLDNDGQVTYQEFISAFARVSTVQIISRMQKLLYGANMSIEQLVTDHVKNIKIMPNEFRAICKKLIPKLADYEIELIFKELDRSGQGALDIAEFVSRFSHLEQERSFQTGIEDIIKPLVTKMKKKGVTSESLFQKYDQNRNNAMSAEELAAALKAEVGTELAKDEIETLQEFFRNKFGRTEIKPAQFKVMMNTKFDRLFQAQKAKRSLVAVEKALRKSGRNAEAIFAAQPQFIAEGNMNEVNIRTFKLAIFSMNILTQQEINNLAKYMDRRNNGMIHIKEFNTALSGGNYQPATIRA